MQYIIPSIATGQNPKFQNNLQHLVYQAFHMQIVKTYIRTSFLFCAVESGMNCDVYGEVGIHGRRVGISYYT